ncbi:MAG TPA: M1 family aminopeptidase [Bryobacteraceae bacterium]|nr:M1 family aminopeptidase [Bryobacteraceae bacterium]
MKRLGAILGLLLPLSLSGAEGAAAGLARQIIDAGLDPEECYRVRDLQFAREDLRIYLTEGLLIFGKAVNGARLTAVFSSDVEHGDAEILVMPPSRAERMSLASFARTPNLAEHFRSGVMVFTDETHAELMKQILARGEPRKEPDQGALLAETWNEVVRNFVSSFQVRLVRDLYRNDRSTIGFFYMAVMGRTLGNFDMVYDPMAREQISIGRVVFREEQSFFDIWTRFQARSFRTGARPLPSPDLQVDSYRIDATLEPDLRLRVVTQASVTPTEGARRVLPFDISSSMRVTEVRIDGEPAEVFQPASLRSTLIRGDQNETFLVMPARPLEPGRAYPIEFRHEGEVITDAGNGVYYVGARGSWYPKIFAQFAKYELTFRYPKELALVATGTTVGEESDGPWRVTRYRIDSPVRMVGFNLGNYEHRTVNRRGYSVEVYANRRVETALEPKPQVVLVPRSPTRSPRIGLPGDQRWTVDLEPVPIERPEIDPAARLEHLAEEVTGALEFMASHFGPPVLNRLTIAPIPGTFGQGFPGLIYLSTLAYLDPKQRPVGARSTIQELFYSEILHAHETAHQWWGNVVASASYEDDWIMEALANYSALLYLEKRKGARALDLVLAEYKKHLLQRTESGEPVDSAGPIIWGPRLSTSQAPDAWRVITYEKGSWIIHMLRRRMGDQRFLEMLGQFRRKYQFQPVTTDQFRRVAAEALPPGFPDRDLELFFDHWVYGTGIPSLKLSYNVRGKAPAVRVTGTVTQSGVSGEFSTLVPIEIQMRNGPPVIHWVRTANEPVSFSVTVKQAPVRVVLDPNNSVLRR